MSDASGVAELHIAPDCSVDHTILDRIVLRPSLDVESTNMDGKTVLLDLSTGRYYTVELVRWRNLGTVYRP